REVKIYAPFGQQYEPVDANMVLSYREAADGQILEEGITEAGALASFTAAGTSYATHGEPMIPFYLFHSMFGFPRTGDLVWVLRAHDRYQAAPEARRRRTDILASGTAMLAALEAQRLLADHHDVAADVWSATSYQMLRADALEVERWNRLHPQKRPRVAYVTEQLTAAPAPVVAVTDYVKSVPDQIARFVPGSFATLGTDGYGRSDTRDALRRHFETDAAHLVVAVLSALGREQRIDPALVSEAMDRYRIDPETPPPLLA